MKYRLVLLLLMVPALACAQEFRSTISGAITDPNGAPVPNAKVAVIETRTGTKLQTVSNTSGQYVVPLLLPGQYEVDVTAPGFRAFLRKGIQLAASAHVVIDVKLEIGTTAQAVQVTASAPILNTSSASIGQTITTREVEDLPLDGRTPLMLAQLSIGVIATSNPSLVHPFDNNGGAAWSIGGTPSQTSEILLDGSPDEIWSGSFAYSPPQDAVEEVQVEAFNTDAAYGHSFAGTLNQVLKSGTNSFHGTAYEFTQPSSLDANNFFNNRSGIPNPVTHFNQYGLTAGGPVIIPKVFNGRDKLFWFFAWENLDDAQPTADFATVPTAAERQGDFSALLGVPGGTKCVTKTDPYNCYQIFNPFSATLSGTTINRQPFANNVIPPAMLNKISQAYLSYYPQPNVAGNADGSDNYANTNTSNDTFNNELGRLDYNINSKNHMFFDMRHNFRSQAKNNYFSNISTGTNLVRDNWGATVDEVATLSPETVADFRANWTYMKEIHGDPSLGFNPTQLGFPSYIAGSAQVLMLPEVGFSGSCGSQTSFQCLGSTGDSFDPSQSVQLFSDVVKIMGNHTLKFGADLRQYRLNDFTYGSPSGSYTFGTNWTQGPTSSSAAAPFGQDFASFLLGLPTGGSYTLNSTGTFLSYYLGAFVQDDWRLKPNLTLNLGLRFDHDTPYSESFGRAVNGFAFHTPNPIAPAAEAAFAKDFPSGLMVGANEPTLPVSAFQVLGGLTFAQPGNGAYYRNTSKMFSPRVGFSWSPAALHDRTVIRGGFGLFVEPITVATLGTNGNYSSNAIVDQEGFSATTSLVATGNNYLSPSATLDNPFPGGIARPTGSSLGLSTFAGQTVPFFNPNMSDPYSVRWNIGLEHSFTPNLMLEMDYVGNHTVHLPIQDTQLNPIPAAYLSTSPTRDQNLINDLSATVANPFEGLLPGSNLNGSKISVAQLLAVYPEFPQGSGSTSTGVLEQNATAGTSAFNALDARVEKRLSKGLVVIGTYSYSKLMEGDEYLNATDSHPEWRVSPFDATHHFVAAVTYDLPIGAGRALNLRSRWANAVAGGWNVNGIYTYQTGLPIDWSNSDYVYLGGPWQYNPTQTGEEVVKGKLVPIPAFNQGVFDTSSADQLEYHIRTFPTTFGNIRYDSLDNLDFSLLKNFSFGESRYLQLRFETFNFLNRPQFGGITSGLNVNPTSSGFGVITAQSNLPRQIQLGARLVW